MGAVPSDRSDVAIVLRTKDRPDFLRRALSSIAGQRGAAWECVVVNDGGPPDDVERVVAALPAAARKRVKIVNHDTPRGRWQSANAGVLASTAPLIVLHDDDDTWHPDFLRHAVDYLEKHPERDGVVGRIEIIWETREGGLLIERGREPFQAHLHDILLTDTLLHNRFVPIGFLYRRRLHEELGLYDESLPVVGDWSFNLRVLQRGPIEFLGDTPLAYWHQRVGHAGAEGNSVIAARDDHERYDALIRDAALREDISEHGLGLALYLTKFIDRRFVEVEQGIRAEIAASSLWRRVGRRLRRR